MEMTEILKLILIIIVRLVFVKLVSRSTFFSLQIINFGVFKLFPANVKLTMPKVGFYDPNRKLI